MSNVPTSRFIGIVSILVALPGIGAGMVAIFFGTSSSPVAVWCVAYWWQLFVVGAALYFLLRGTAFIARRLNHY